MILLFLTFLSPTVPQLHCVFIPFVTNTNTEFLGKKQEVDWMGLMLLLCRVNGTRKEAYQHNWTQFFRDSMNWKAYTNTPNFTLIPLINVTTGQTQHVHEKGVAFKIVIHSDAHV